MRPTTVVAKTKVTPACNGRWLKPREPVLRNRFTTSAFCGMTLSVVTVKELVSPGIINSLRTLRHQLTVCLGTSRVIISEMG